MRSIEYAARHRIDRVYGVAQRPREFLTSGRCSGAFRLGAKSPRETHTTGVKRQKIFFFYTSAGSSVVCNSRPLEQKHRVHTVYLKAVCNTSIGTLWESHCSQVWGKRNTCFHHLIYTQLSTPVFCGTITLFFTFFILFFHAYILKEPCDKFCKRYSEHCRNNIR